MALAWIAGTWAVSRIIDGEVALFLKADDWDQVSTGISTDAGMGVPRVEVDSAGTIHLLSAADGSLLYNSNHCAF